MIRAAALALLLALAACAGQAPAPTEHATTEPHFADGMFVAEDGAHLPLRVWLPKGDVKATILALHGFNDYSHAFEGPAEILADNGIATYAYDQRGFGEAPDRGHWAGTWRLDEDMAIASKLIAAQHPGVPHYLLGESMGGAVVMTGLTGTAHADRPVADGIILSAPAVWGRADMNVFERSALWLADSVAPGVTVTGSGLDITPSDNIRMLRGLWYDPLVIKATRVDAIKGLVDLMDAAYASAPHVTGPVLLLYGEHDEIIPRAPITDVIAALPKASADERRIALYPAGYHMLLRDLDGPLVVHDIESWIADRAAPLPSGADRNARQVLVAGR